MARNVTTEWEDIHVKKGNWKTREEVGLEVAPDQEAIFQTQQVLVEGYDQFKGMTKDQIDEAIEDDLDLEEDEVLQAYRDARIKEMQANADKTRWSGILDITKQDYEWHVNQLPEDSLGVILLYQEHIPEAMLLYDILACLAKKHPTRKFMRCVATKCVENYQDKDVPALIFYKSGNNLINHIAGAQARQMFGGKRMNVDTVEYVLAKECNFLEVEFKEDPRDSLKTFNAFIHKKKAFLGKDEDQSGSEGEDDREYLNNQMFRYKHKTK